MWLKLIFILVIICPWTKCYPNCAFITNRSIETITLPHHKYMVVEKCLFYKLHRDANIREMMSYSLSKLPPTKNAGDVIAISVGDVIIKTVFVNEKMKDTVIDGSISISWNDFRMIWNAAEWRQQDTLKVKNSRDLWVPDLIPGISGSITESTRRDWTYTAGIKARSNGTITAKLLVYMTAKTETNFYNFPRDIITTRFQLHSQLFGEVTSFDVTNANVKLDPHGHQIMAQKVEEMNIRVLKNDVDEPVLEVELKLSRKSTTLALQLTIPMVLCGLVVLIAPLCGQMQQQCWMKLVGLLPQIICLELLSRNHPQLRYGGIVPKIYQFYEFTMVITVLGLIVTLACKSALRFQFEKSVPGQLTRFTRITGKLFRCCYEYDETISDDGTDQNEDTISDWRQLLVAINNCSSVVLGIVYLVGILALCT